MALPLEVKLDLVDQVLSDLVARRTVVPIGRHVDALARHELALLPAAGAGPRVEAGAPDAAQELAPQHASLEGARHG